MTLPSGSMAQEPLVITELLPESIKGEEQVSRIATAVEQVSFDPGLATVLRRFLEESSDPPEPVLGALANELHVDDWDPSWSNAQKQRRIKASLEWHEEKGTPNGIRETLRRGSLDQVRIFEQWVEPSWVLLATSFQFDDTELDSGNDRTDRDLTVSGEADLVSVPRVDSNGHLTWGERYALPQFLPDGGLAPNDYWVAIRPGFGPASEWSQLIDLSERVAARRAALLAPSVAPTRNSTSVVSGKYNDGVLIESPSGELLIGELLPSGSWALSAWVDLVTSDMDAGGALLSAHRNPATYAQLRRDQSTTDFELRVVVNGATIGTAPVTSLADGERYLTLSYNGTHLMAFEGGALLASIETDVFSSAWQPAVGSRPGSSNADPTAFSNLVFSEVMFWRTHPSEAQMTDQPTRATESPAEEASVWPAVPYDRY
jgi:phage tail P2-like protein